MDKMRDAFGKTFSASPRKTRDEKDKMMRFQDSKICSGIFSETGAISPGLLLLTLVLASAAFSVLGYALNWRKNVALQLRMDRCVEEKSVLFLRLQNRLEASNSRMKMERAAALAAAIPSGGASLKAVRAILTAERTLQESVRIAWGMEEGKWILRRGCDSKGDFFLPLPKMEWWRPPDDVLGPLPLVHRPGKSPPRILLWKEKRSSQATIFRSLTRFPGEKGTWSARWSGKEGWIHARR
jgi:hypothetical protein